MCEEIENVNGALFFPGLGGGGDRSEKLFTRASAISPSFNKSEIDRSYSEKDVIFCF